MRAGQEATVRVNARAACSSGRQAESPEVATLWDQIRTAVRLVASSYLERWFSLLGAIFILVVLFMPQGIVPGLRHARRPRRQPAP